MHQVVVHKYVVVVVAVCLALTWVQKRGRYVDMCVRVLLLDYKTPPSSSFLRWCFPCSQIKYAGKLKHTFTTTRRTNYCDGQRRKRLRLAGHVMPQVTSTMRFSWVCERRTCKLCSYIGRRIKCVQVFVLRLLLCCGCNA